MIQQLYHVGQHGDADNSFQPNWSPSGLPSYHDADGSHAMTVAEIEEVIAGFIAAAVRAREAGFDGVEVFATYHALVDQFWTPWSNRRTRRVGRHRRGPDAVLVAHPRRHPRGLWRRLHRRSRGQRGPRVRGLVVARRDGRHRRVARRTPVDGLRHVRHGLLLRLLQAHADVPLPAAARGAVRRPPQGGGPARRRPGREPHPDARGRRGRSSRPVRPTWSASSAARSRTRTSSRRPAPGDRRTCGGASPATSCAGAGARATTGSRASSTRPRAARRSGAAIGSSRPPCPGPSWSSVAGRPVSRRRGSRPSVAIG